MENNDELIDNEGVTTKKEVPGFLKTLCVLTYIACGLGLATALGAIALGASIADKLDSVPGMGAIAENALLWAILTIVACAAGIYGANQMWKLNKQGFYIYIGSHVVSLITPIILGIPFAGVSALIFPAAFIAMYGMNLKHMS